MIQVAIGALMILLALMGPDRAPPFTSEWAKWLWVQGCLWLGMVGLALIVFHFIL